MMAAPTISLNMDSIIDAEFETVRPVTRAEPASSRPAEEIPTPVIATDGLSLLRAGNTENAQSSHPEQLTPTFLLFTFVAAMVVFWVSGGHALLY